MTSRPPRLIFRALLLLLVGGIVLSCGDDEGSGSGGSTDSLYTLAKVAGDSQTAAPGASVATDPMVMVLDQHNVPVAGVVVSFSVTGGGGGITGATADTTGADGLAVVGGWTLGAAPVASNTLSASAVGAAPVTFTAQTTAGPTDSLYTLVKVAGDSQTAVPGATLTIDPVVMVRDQHGDPVAGVVVSFAVGLGGGIIPGADVATTGADGLAVVGGWTLGGGSGATNTLTATLAGATPVTFTAQSTVIDHGEYDFLLEAPQDDAHFQDTLYVQLLTNNPHPMSGVTYTLGALSGAMTYIGPYGSTQRWSAKIATKTLPHGPVNLEVTATDVQAHVGHMAWQLVHNDLPVVTVTSPWDTALAAPLLHVQASCTDDGPIPCTVQVFRKQPAGLFLLASAPNAIDTLLDFAPINNYYDLVVVGLDSDGDKTEVTRPVIRQVQNTLAPLASVDGRILDYDGSRVLYVRQAGDSFQLAIRTLSSGAEELIPVKSKYGFFRGRLHPTGAVFTRDLTKVVNVDQGTGSLHRWASGAATELVASRSYELWTGQTAVTAEGDHFLFGATEVTMSSGVVTTLPALPAMTFIDVAANGDIVVSNAGGGGGRFVMLYRGGVVIISVAADGDYPVTDGGRIIYNDFDVNGRRRSRLVDTLGIVADLATPFLTDWVPLGGHRMNYGWIAYTDSTARVWTQSPTGVRRMVSSVGRVPQEVGPNGEVVYADGGFDAFYFVGTATVVASEIGIGKGRVLWVGGTPYKLSYNMLFQVNP